MWHAEEGSGELRVGLREVQVGDEELRDAILRLRLARATWKRLFGSLKLFLYAVLDRCLRGVILIFFNPCEVSFLESLIPFFSPF